MADLNEKLQWVYTVHLLGGVQKEIDVKRGVLLESYSIHGEDVTSAIIGLDKRGLIDVTLFNKAKASPTLQAEIDKTVSRNFTPRRGVRQ